MKQEKDRIGALLEAWLVDTHGEDEQRDAVCASATDALELPMDKLNLHAFNPPESRPIEMTPVPIADYQ